MHHVHSMIEGTIPRLRRYAIALSRNPVDADDLVQETLLRALSKLHLWEVGSNLHAWLFTIMHHQRANDVRRAVRGSKIFVDTAADLGRPGSQLDSIQLQELGKALACLPAAQRSVVLLIGLEGMTYEEVAGILDVPIGTVRSRLARARAALREMIDEPAPRQQRRVEPALAALRNLTARGRTIDMSPRENRPE
jgi:RNA polymerase sigma-70 factor (ECF subfamily)